MNNKAVEVKALEKRFGEFVAVNRIGFDVRSGEIFGFLGPNGAGKSTTIRMLCGILKPTSGSGQVGGFDILKEQESIKQNIGYMSQRFSLYEDLTAEENIDFYAGIYRIPISKRADRKEWVIKMAGLEEHRKSLTAVLSGGWKQRLALGCAILHEPGIVFLDEPTAGVDPISRRNFWALIKDMASKGVTVFVTTHNMDEAENCHKVALIYRGTIIAQGSPNELKTKDMKEEVLLVSLPRAQDWTEKLSRLPEVKEAALFALDLHVLTSDSVKAAQAMKRLFEQSGLSDYRITKIPPSLEDVFVSLIEAHDRNTS